MTTSDPAGPPEQPREGLLRGVAFWLAETEYGEDWEQMDGAQREGYLARASELLAFVREPLDNLADARPVSPSPATTEAEKLRRQVEAHRAVARDWYLRYEEAQQRFLDLAGSLGDDSATTEAGPTWCPSCELVVGTNRYKGAVTGWDHCASCSTLLTSPPSAAAPVPAEEVHTEWGYRWTSPRRTFVRKCETEQDAREEAEGWPDRATVVRRTVQTGPWVAADEEEQP